MQLPRTTTVWSMVVFAFLPFGFVSPDAGAQVVTIDGVLDHAGPIGAGREERAIAAIKRVGGKVEVFRSVTVRDGRVMAVPKGLRPRFVQVRLRGSQITDAELRLLEGLQDVRFLSLTDTRVTDAGIADLRQSFPRVHITRR